MKKLVTLALVLLPAVAAAHRPSDSFLRLEAAGARLEGRLDLHLRDLDDALGLDGNGDGAVTGRELGARATAVTGYALAHLRVGADGRACTVDAGELGVVELDGGSYAALPLSIACPSAATTITVGDEIFFHLDAHHRGLISLVHAGGVATAVTRDDARQATFTLAASPRWSAFTGFLGEGIHHIWIGLDHILFLLALLLPSVLAATRFRPVAVDVLQVVTAFTVAHSITLALAVLELVRLPTRLVETAIAATVVLAALNNVVPVVRARWPVAFGLGLLHGFGFSGVLGDLGISGGGMAAALLGFNAGVELGQAAIVLVFLPLAYALRRTWAYRRLILVGGSLAVALLALVWTAQRLAA